MFRRGVPAILGVQMALVRGIDILVAGKHPTDDGVFADMTNLQRMPIRPNLKQIAIHYTEDSKHYGTNDIFCLTKALNNIFQAAGAPIPFTFGSGLDGKLNFWPEPFI